MEIGGEHVLRERMHRIGDQHALALRQAARHERRFGQGGGAVVHRRVGHVHPRQLADEALKLVDGLQRALRHLRLVGRIRGQKLAAAHQMADGAGHEVAVGAGPEEARVVIEVLVTRRHTAHLRPHLPLRLPRWHIQLREAMGRRNIAKQVGDGRDANSGEHLLALCLSR